MTTHSNKRRRMTRSLGLALLGLALTFPLTACMTREAGNRYNLMYRSQLEQPARPETVGETSATPVSGATEDQRDKATHGIIS